MVEKRVGEGEITTHAPPRGASIYCILVCNTGDVTIHTHLRGHHDILYEKGFPLLLQLTHLCEEHLADEAEEDEKTAYYKQQLEIYAKALQAIYHNPVAGNNLVSLRTCRQVSC